MDKRIIKGFTRAMIGMSLFSMACVDQQPSQVAEREDTAYETFAQGLNKGTVGAANGDGNYCGDVDNLCDIGEGDCDSSAQCAGDLICPRDNGANFGFASGLDVCVPAHCANRRHDADEGEVGIDCGGDCGTCPSTNPYPNGHRLHCADPLFPCGIGEGDCNTHAQCAGDLMCGRDNGDHYGFASGLDVCAPAHCINHVYNPEEGEIGIDCGGDCGACPETNPYANGDRRHCSDPRFPCGEGEGRCYSDDQCADDLICGDRNGMMYGFSSPIDVCEPAFVSLCMDGVQSGDEQGVDCGGSCATPCESTVVQISAGELHTCALTDLGEVKCWGDNSDGQLGDGSVVSRLTPVDVVGVSGAVFIASGKRHTCAVLEDGSVTCWGSNASGQLGDGSKIDSQIPVNAHGLTGVTQISAGDSHTCALHADGSVQCWGFNLTGQLGDGTIFESSTPVDVVSVSDATSISAGANHTCAVLDGGEMKCWGLNLFGQLGQGSPSIGLVALDVPGVLATTASAGQNHTCASQGDNTVKCWGLNVFGQLGDGSTQNSHSGVVVAGLNDIKAVASGGLHSCALRAGNVVQCWGLNVMGQLGNGSLLSSSTPVAVKSLAGVKALTAGQFHTCALHKDGVVKCWGSNTEGQLGEGASSLSMTPVEVVFPD